MNLELQVLKFTELNSFPVDIMNILSKNSRSGSQTKRPNSVRKQIEILNQSFSFASLASLHSVLNVLRQNFVCKDNFRTPFSTELLLNSNVDFDSV